LVFPFEFVDNPVVTSRSAVDESLTIPNVNITTSEYLGSNRHKVNFIKWCIHKGFLGISIMVKDGPFSYD
jgi:hypothetical protein